jgi:uncharacterized GH25 family protein
MTQMKNLLQLTLLLIALTIGQSAFAHALWVETNPSATIDQTHQVRIFYGEYANQEIEPIENWYSDVKDFTLWLTTPSQQKVKLEKQATADFFQSSFTPTEEGIYTLTVVHAAKDLGGTTKFEFSSTAFVTAGNANISAVRADIPLYAQIQPKVHQKGQQISTTVYKQGKPLADAEVIVMSEEGWAKTFKTDAQGQVSFPVLWAGNYVIEVSDYVAEQGLWHEKAYKNVWRGATTFIQVN